MLRTCLLLLVTAALLPACASSTGPHPHAERLACAHAGEFASTGCFAVTGVVVDGAGQPYADVVLQLRFLPRSGTFATGPVTSAADGTFRLVGTRVSPVPADGARDTVAVYVQALDPRTAGVGVPARVQDSVQVRATMAPVGAVPSPSAVRITLGG